LWNLNDITYERLEVPPRITAKSILIWNVTRCSLVQFYWRFRATYSLHFLQRRASPASYSQAECLLVSKLLSQLSVLKMEAVNTSETPVKLYQIAQYHILHDGILQRCFHLMEIRT
jgi:hypothetical protein